MTNTIQGNGVNDCTSEVYAEIRTELSRQIKQKEVYHENETGQRRD